MSASLKSKVESWAIAAITAAGVTPTPVAIDSDAKAEQERIIVSAKVGERQLEGAQAYPVDVDIELRSTTRNAAAVDAIFASVEAAMISPDADAITAAQSTFSELTIFPERMVSDSSRGGDTRTRSRTYPLIALSL